MGCPEKGGREPCAKTDERTAFLRAEECVEGVTFMLSSLTTVGGMLASNMSNMADFVVEKPARIWYIN